MPKPRPFPFAGSQAGVFHVVSRVAGREFILGREEKDFFVRLMRAYEDLLGVEVLTWCVMSNHFHLLVRVPHHPEEHHAGGTDENANAEHGNGPHPAEEAPSAAPRPPLDGPDVETLLLRLRRAVGRDHYKQLKSRMDMWMSSGQTACIEQWRQRQLARMYSLSEFVRCLKQRFTRWYNRRNGRCGVLWESRFTSVIVEEEHRALRAMAAYIDLNPVRAGLVNDPAGYRWSGYAAAMRGEGRAQEGLVKVAGRGAWSREDARRSDGGPGWEQWRRAPAKVRRRALLLYRSLLGAAGAERRTADGQLVRRGAGEAELEKLRGAGEGQLVAEMMARRVRHFTAGVIVGSRAYIERWFESNRDWFRGRSRTERRSGARSMGRPALRGLYSLRTLRD